MADDFAASPEVRRARILYREQKQALRLLAEQVMLADPSTDTYAVAQDIATLLHNISGTAAYFGESDFGCRASALEQPVRSSFTAGLVQPLCSQILACIDG